MSTSQPAAPRRFFLVLPAAGSGQRMGSECPKQYLTINGRTLLQHTLERLGSMACFERVVLVLAAKDSWWPAIEKQLPGALREKLQIAVGGSQRADSVLNGLQALQGVAQAQDWVLVHDVVRPCIQPSDVEMLIKTLKDETAGGLLATPLRDTLKRSSVTQTVEQTVDRSNLWCAATPQMFRYELLLQALRKMAASSTLVTDEAEAMEACGHLVKLVQGRTDNLKVTWPQDLQLAALILGAELAAEPGEQS